MVIEDVLDVRRGVCLVVVMVVEVVELLDLLLVLGLRWFLVRLIVILELKKR